MPSVYHSSDLLRPKSLAERLDGQKKYRGFRLTRLLERGFLSFGDYRMRGVGANTRWQIFVLVAANLMELVRKTKLEKMAVSPAFTWFTKAVERMHQTTKITLGIAIKIISDLRRGGRDLILSGFPNLFTPDPEFMRTKVLLGPTSLLLFKSPAEITHRVTSTF